MYGHEKYAAARHLHELKHLLTADGHTTEIDMV
jgi:hypothetical protein